jgi:hypothetical protein
LSPAPTLASGPGPNGVNIGFDFNWSPGPSGDTATFISSVNSSGATLATCIGVCNFAFAYSIGGVAQTPVVSGGAYETWNLHANGFDCDTSNGTTPNNTAPLTLFNCFNQDSFGQVFQAGTTGALTAFSMPMTCLNPAGTNLTGLFALIYLVNGATIPATPLATTPVDLSTCPTLTNWSGHTFSAADFATIPINFSGVHLTAGSSYGVFFAGLVPGTPPPGFNVPFSAFSAKLDLAPGLAGSFDLNSTFVLASGGSIDPVTEPFTFSIGPYTVTIPAGSFHQLKNGAKKGGWVFSGNLGGVNLDIQIDPLGGGAYQFKAQGAPANFTGVTSPTAVSISINNNRGTIQVPF